MTFSQLLKLSRPHFWTYITGPYITGFTLGAISISGFLSWQFWYGLFFFLIPANIFIYGINDVFDHETDKLNPKKQKKELLMNLNQKKKYLLWIAIAMISGMPLLISMTFKAQIFLLFFYFLSFFYSAPPLRFKSKPFIDSASNILYALPGFVGYAQLTNEWPPLWVISASFCFTFAMHLFSAIPDIAYDKKTNIKTTAVLLGKQNSLLFCFLLWTVMVFQIIFIHPLFILSCLYPAIPLLLIFNTNLSITRVYWWFPYINNICGISLSIYSAIHLL